MTRLLFFISCFISVTVFAQTVKEYTIQQFTTDNGMPSNGIKGLQWDEQTGFLWIATEAGMTRYDGLGFTNFTKENTPGLSHERMAYIVKNNNAAIYAADVNGRFIAVKTSLLVPQPLPELNDVVGFKKRFYLCASGSTLQQKVLSFMKETGDMPWDRLLQPNDTSLIVIAAGRKVYATSAAQKNFTALELPAGLRNEFIADHRLFFMDKDRQVYIAANNFRDFQPISILAPSGENVPVNSSNFLLFWENGMRNPILFSGSNAWLLHYRNNSLEAELICSAIPSYSFIRTAQYSEKNKTLFIGTDSKGIIIINKNRVSSLKNADTDIRERNAYYSQVELANGNVLTNESHILGTNAATNTDLPIKGKFNYTVFTSGDSLLWFSQNNAVYKKNLLHQYNYTTGKTTAFYKIPQLVENFAIGSSGGQHYLVSSTGFGRLQEDSLVSLFKPAANKQGSGFYMMTEFSPGVLGVASCDGLILYDVNKKTTDTILKAGGYCVRSLWKYQDYIFIGTYGKGYYIWKNGQLRSMPLDKNKFLLYTHCFVPDENGFCWLSSNRGLFKAQLADLINAFEKNNQQVYYHYYGKNDGMEITEMNGGCAPCALLMKNKTISFPTMDGLLWVNPDQAMPLLPEGNIYLDEFRAGTKKINPDSLELLPIAYTDNDIRMKLAFSAWCNKENIYLEYRLNDKSAWTAVEPGNEALIRLDNLLPGKYTVSIRKMNGFGIDNYSYKKIVFSIVTPWHRQWWFFMLCLFTAFGLVALYLQVRTRQYKIQQRKLEQQVTEKTKELQEQNEVLEKNNSIKTRLISIISHDIVTPLKFLTVAGKNLLEKRKLMPEELQQETIREITNTSQELQLLSTNILNWIKYQNENRRLVKENFNLHEMVGQVLGILQSLARQKKLVIENKVDESTEIQQYYEPLKILVYNLLTNAIHFTEKGTITVSAEKTNGHITVSVKDEGIGMTPEQIQRLMADEVVITAANVDNKKGHGLGYLIIKDLLKTMGASLHIESKRGEGATVSIKMPG